MKSLNLYELALEAFLQRQGVLYQTNRESWKQLAKENGFASAKTPDFLLTFPNCSWLVDVVGRRFPSGSKKPQYWRNWILQSDLSSLLQWERHFGGNFAGLFVFAFEIVGEMAPLPEEQLFSYQNRRYAFVAVPATVYATFQRPLSSAWKTITMPVAAFRQQARPLQDVLGPLQES